MPAPISPPIATGRLTFKARAHSRAFFWWKLQVADRAPISTGMRLVPLAETGSRPIIIRTGSETADPEEAAVFKNPQAKPAPNPKTSAQRS